MTSPKEPPVEAYATSDKASFAYISARDRWPVILTGAIDDLHKAVDACENDTKIAEGKKIISSLAALKYELQHDRTLPPLEDDGAEDIEAYNAELVRLGNPSWFNGQWLYLECYLYRRLATLFARSEHWKAYDVFAKQKNSTFQSSRKAVTELAGRIKELNSGKMEAISAEQATEAEKLLFFEMCDICLWGNATDLSLLTSITLDDIQKLQGADARKAAEENILANDLAKAYTVLKQLKSQGGDVRVDIVLDNAGFELFVDLILATYLLSSGLAATIVLHPKTIPWFVSDVVPADFMALLNALADSKNYFTDKTNPLSEDELENLDSFFKTLAELHQEGKIVIRPNRFWTEFGSFWRLPDSEALYSDLKQSQLVIFKGDLNYRKLTGDAAWDPTTPFETAVGPLGRDSGLRILALRTCKADVVVGLARGLDERLRQGSDDPKARKWAWSGKYAVVQFSDGKA